MKYLVIGTGGPGFASADEAVVVLEKGILPTFEVLMKLEAGKTIVAGGLPAAERTFVFIMEASSNEEADKLVRNIPAWGALEWEVKPLVSFEDRAALERSLLAEMKKTM